MTKQVPRKTDAFQIDLLGLFLLVTLCAVFFAVGRAAGLFLATLLTGPILLSGVIVLLRIESPIGGLLIGALLAATMIMVATAAFGPDSHSIGASQTGVLVTTWVVYPPLGSAYGLIHATHRQIRRGI
ncbi:MAG: hypothetical protein AAF958_12050 [Planctomycetota bacterium]